MNEPFQTAIRQEQGTSRKWLFRLLAICCGLSLFLLIELFCRGFGLGEQQITADPFVGFSDVQPLFFLDENTQRYRIAKPRLDFFADESFPVQKSPETKRIFCLGGSTVQGRPFSIETSFPTWLKIALNHNDTRQTWEVVNCGGISYASYRLVPILQECLEYEPDLFIVCTGHNEFLEDRSYAHVRERASYIGPVHALLSNSRSYRLLRSGLLGLIQAEPAQTPQLTPEVDAILDYKEGLKAYHRDDLWKRDVALHFESNLNRIVEITSEQNVPLLFVLPPSNLTDSPPFKSEHRASITEAETAEFQQLLAVDNSKTARFIETVNRLEATKEIDPQFAAVRYQLGRMYLRQDRQKEARLEFLAARDEDICPLRMITVLETAMRRVAEASATPLLDAHQLLESKTDLGILNNALLVDHVHPSFKGNQMIALALTDKLEQLGLVNLSSNWQETAKQAFQTHFDGLSSFYFARGERTLKGLRAWTQGRADGPPVESRFPERLK